LLLEVSLKTTTSIRQAGALGCSKEERMDGESLSLAARRSVHTEGESSQGRVCCLLLRVRGERHGKEIASVTVGGMHYSVQ